MNTHGTDSQAGGAGLRGMTRRAFIGGLAAAALPVAPKPVLAAPLRQFRPSGNGGADHAAFDRLLVRYVKPDEAGYNRFAYRAFASAHGQLKSYISMLEAQTPSRFSSAEAHAYWINLYNAKTLDIVLDHYPVASIKRINLGGGGLFGSGPWAKPLLTVEGQPLSLDDIEHGIVRPIFADPMSHYALNCASYSCPNLVERAYSGDNLKRLMAANARAYVNHPRGVLVERGTITASKIYTWYASDFGGRGNLKRHWTQFAAAGQAAAIEQAAIGAFVYDWSLNDA